MLPGDSGRNLGGPTAASPRSLPRARSLQAAGKTGPGPHSRRPLPTPATDTSVLLPPNQSPSPCPHAPSESESLPRATLPLSQSLRCSQPRSAAVWDSGSAGRWQVFVWGQHRGPRSWRRRTDAGVVRCCLLAGGAVPTQGRDLGSQAALPSSCSSEKPQCTPPGKEDPAPLARDKALGAVRTPHWGQGLLRDTWQLQELGLQYHRLCCGDRSFREYRGRVCRGVPGPPRAGPGP